MRQCSILKWSNTFNTKSFFKYLLYQAGFCQKIRGALKSVFQTDQNSQNYTMPPDKSSDGDEKYISLMVKVLFQMGWRNELEVFGMQLGDGWILVTRPILIDFHLVSLSGLGSGQVVARLGKSDCSALPTHSWRAKNRISSALKVKCLSRLDYKVERNSASKVLSKTRGQMSTWLLFSSFTIWSLQTD